MKPNKNGLKPKEEEFLLANNDFFFRCRVVHDIREIRTKMAELIKANKEQVRKITNLRAMAQMGLDQARKSLRN